MRTGQKPCVWHKFATTVLRRLRQEKCRELESVWETHRTPRQSISKKERRRKKKVLYKTEECVYRKGPSEMHFCFKLWLCSPVSCLLLSLSNNERLLLNCDLFQLLLMKTQIYIYILIIFLLILNVNIYIYIYIYSWAWMLIRTYFLNYILLQNAIYFPWDGYSWRE